MGLVNKLKNILFEEEEVEVPVIEKKEKVVSEPIIREMPRKEEAKVPDYSNFYNEEVVSKPMPQKEVVAQPPKREEIRTNIESVSEREIFKSEKTFNFPAFDEEEFESSMPRRTTNVLEHEKRRFRDKNVKKAEVPKKEETKVETPKFRPSPIISPVYGILDKNYTPDDITTRDTIPKALDVDSVRKKAFGTLEEDIMDMSVTYKKSEVQEERDFLEEKLEKARTIDELLKDSSDEILDVDSGFSDITINYEDKSDIDLENTLSSLSRNMKNESEIVDALDATIDSLEEEEIIPKQPETIVAEEDSLESDLFDLIDSMYENREDGE